MTELGLKEIEAREAAGGLRRPVRVLYVVDGTQPSYDNKQLVRLLGQFGRMQLKAAVASLEKYGDAAVKIQGKNVPVVSLEVEPGKSNRLSEKLGALMRLRSLIAHNNPEVLHLIGENARTLGVLAASSFRALPVLSATLMGSRRGLWTRGLDLAGALLAPQPRQLFLDEDEVFAAKERFGKFRADSVIGHGIDGAAAVTAPLMDFEQLSAGEFDIGLLVKSPHCLCVKNMLGAFKVFRGHCPHARLILFGDVDELEIEPWIEDLGLSGHVLPLPLPPEPGSLLGRLNVLWLHDEPFPNQDMALQAMAIGLPVVIDHTTGLASDIQEIGGAIMRDGAWPEQFAEATRELMDQEELRENVGHAGKILVKERHTIRAQAEKLRSLYAYLVHGEDV